MSPDVSLIYTCFPALSATQKRQLAALGELYTHCNAQVNLISRRDLGQLYLHHVLHSLSIARVIDFRPGSRLLDVGTGGGFPGIPLAILFPEAQWHLVDSIGKKIKKVAYVAEQLGLTNVVAEQVRAEQLACEQYDFVLSRAVASLSTLYGWLHDKLLPDNRHPLANGLLCLKGGDLERELQALGSPYTSYPLLDFFPQAFFASKYLIHVPALGPAKKPARDLADLSCLSAKPPRR